VTVKNGSCEESNLYTTEEATHRWEENINMDRKGVEYEVVGYIRLA
jgi:hypothetical protein